ncbi:hypothetical protein L3Q82_004559 [Scortum barcoo]|uniref:Uncharacterized protein n=1 Tax=Scortum barcoo TaxID=214431 RepID=A0ACB8VHX0_9TELE|nr:hypothetical protein L3Q82_004559 [Scortum barcoo]
MSFLRRVAGRSLRDRVRSSVTREELGVEPLLLRIERSQLRWLGHLFRMPPGRLPREVFQACPTGRRPRGRPRTRWRNYVSLGWPGNASGSPWKSWRKCLGFTCPFMNLTAVKYLFCQIAFLILPCYSSDIVYLFFGSGSEDYNEDARQELLGLLGWLIPPSLVMVSLLH